MRSSKGVAAVVGTAGLLAAAAAIAFAGFGGAVANISADDPNLSEIIRTAPETFADLTVAPPKPQTDAEALTAAVRAPTPPTALEWTQAGLAVVERWAPPRLQDDGPVARADASGWRRRVAFDFSPAEARSDQKAETRIELGFGKKTRVRDAVRERGEQALQRLGLDTRGGDEAKRRGRWFLFAASGNDAVGMNMLRSRDGELKRAGWSAEKIGKVGDIQAGVGWRKGPLQASLAFVEREVSGWGRNIDERFLAFTFSVRPPGGAKGPADGRIRRAEAYSTNGWN